MGNRATVIFKHGKEHSPSIYLHWNGGPESVYAFLEEMKRRKVRSGDPAYQSARFIHIVGDFFDQEEACGLSLGCWNWKGKIEDQSEQDNGLYLVEGEYAVRRCLSGNWLTPEKAEAERKSAVEDDKHLSILEVLRELRPDVEDPSSEAKPQRFGTRLVVVCNVRQPADVLGTLFVTRPDGHGTARKFLKDWEACQAEAKESVAKAVRGNGTWPEWPVIERLMAARGYALGTEASTAPLGRPICVTGSEVRRIKRVEAEVMALPLAA